MSDADLIARKQRCERLRREAEDYCERFERDERGWLTRAGKKLASIEKPKPAISPDDALAANAARYAAELCTLSPEARARFGLAPLVDCEAAS